MNESELEQRAEEIELALADIFESPKAPAMSSYDEGTRFFVQISWVVESRGDTTLDTRRVLTLTFTTSQFERYAEMDTAHRKAFQSRLRAWVKQRFAEQRDGAVTPGDCSLETVVPDELFS